MARSKMIRRENLSQGACIVQLHKRHQLGGRKSPSERMQQDQGAIRKKGFDLRANCKIRQTMEKIELSASSVNTKTLETLVSEDSSFWLKGDNNSFMQSISTCCIGEL
jgi:hypothetical protein